MTDALHHYCEIWLCDFEFRAPDGERPEPICMVAREWRTGRTIRVWRDALLAAARPPFPTGADALFVAYYASAELGCFRVLGWPAPARILDLFAEFRCLTNGLPTTVGNSLLGALAHFGLDGIDAAEKGDLRALAMRGGPYTGTEERALLDYCESDVVALAKLLTAMLPTIDLPRALLRGRYMAAAAAMEFAGVPIDVPTLDALRANWGAIKGRLIERVDADFRVFIPAGRYLDRSTRQGRAVLDAAEASGVDAYELDRAARFVWSEERETKRDRAAVIEAARRATGLTLHRISAWENSGKDYSTYPGLDTRARELAAEYPELGIGSGYKHESGYDDTDYAGALWELLRDETPRPAPRHDPDILDRAADMVADAPPLYGDAAFSAKRFAEYLAEQGIPWPRLPSGQLALDDDTFRDRVRLFPQLAPLRELRHALGELRLFSDLAVGSDGRNRCLLSAFRTITGRNAPSNARFIFGPSCWLRSLIRPEPDRAVAYVDWSQQEFGIAAALSGDPTMMEAYSSGDPYLAFAKQAGAVPADATKKTHPGEREQFKVCALAVQYGMGAESLALSLNAPPAFARELLRLHRQTYPRFWCWSQAAVDRAMLQGRLHTVFGWTIQVGREVNPRSLANFPMQANGAEMLRLACCLATERGIIVCAPIHDALLVEGPADGIEAVVADTQAAMGEASRTVLGGFELRTDALIVRYPDRYVDKRGERMWGVVTEILGELESAGVAMEAEPF